MTTPPEDGKANAALLALVADWLGVPKSKVALASGQKSRVKSVAVGGDSDELIEKSAGCSRPPRKAARLQKSKGRADG